MKIYAFILSVVLLSGCANNQSKLLYCYEDTYTKSVMETINEEGDSLASIQKMEQNLNTMLSKNCKPAPGYYAHLGYLYSKIGNKIKANEYFNKEAEIFPESSQFAYFAKSDHKTQQAITNGKFNTTKGTK